MSLLHPTFGQMHDRMAILKLKICHSASEELKLEFEQIRIRLQNHKGHFVYKEAVLLDERLLELHTRLWECENSVRQFATVFKLAAIAKEIASLNDERNRLIQEIDRAYGYAHTVEDKIYS